MNIHYVEFDTPGVFFPETETRKVADRIPAHLKKIPEGTYAIQYYDREERTESKERLTGKAKHRSARIVFGKVYTKAQLLSEGFTERDPLYHNADNSDGKVIKCNQGNWQPWDKSWHILTAFPDLKTLTEPI